MKSRITVFAASLLIAGATTHAVAVFFMPEMLLAYVVSKLPGKVNQAFHSSRITDRSRRIVRPSPDLLYTICPYDLAAGKLQISAVPPPDSYVSLALYDDMTNNYFLLNRRELSRGSRLTLYLEYAPEARRASAGSSRGASSRRGRGLPLTALSPTRKGVALFRILLKSPEQYEALRTFQKTQNCRIVAPPGGRSPSPAIRRR